jgi:hypothetical protein
MQARIKSTNTTPRRPTRARRGNVIILAVAVLAVLAISAASYVTITRLDRSSAAAYSRRSGFIQQRDAALGHIRALLAADLFGNKIVETSTPRTDNRGNQVWPVLFEDGEHWDYPWALAVPFGNARHTWDRRTTAEKQNFDPVSPQAQLNFSQNLGADGMYETAWPDDAWLASSEPVDASPARAGLRWDTWPQLTNLRSEYRYNRAEERWERADGRYVDLARFFLSDDSTRLRRGDPGADLTILEQDAVNGRPGPGINLPAVQTTAEQFAGPVAMLEQPVYHLQMAQIEEARQDGDYAGFNPDSFDPNSMPYEMVDTRFFADTDGDGRPDARWQEIDALGTSKGLRWVAATRITDASALVNVNASLEWGDPGDADTLGAGTTPADIDLRRLIETASRSTGLDAAMRHPDINNLAQSAFTAHFNEHLTSGLNLGALASGTTQDERDSKIMPEIQERLNLSLGDPIGRWEDEYNRRQLGDWQQGTDGVFEPGSLTDGLTRLTRAQKEAHYRFVGSSIDLSSLQFRAGYDWKDNEVDLRAFWGFNYDTSVSPLEQRLDGPDGTPFNRLPGSTPLYPDQASLGPMRSHEALESVRTFGETATLPSPVTPFTQEEKIERIEKDVRRLLTTYNGSGFVSPQAGWNRTGSEDRPSTNVELDPDLRFSDIDQYERQMTEFLQGSLGAFMWALAPFATDRPPMRAGNIGSPVDLSQIADYRAAYGGWQNGPAEAFEAPFGSVLPGGSGAVYALRTAAALSVNLADAIDHEGFDPTPTIAQVFKTYDIGLAKQSGSTTLGRPLPADAQNNGIIELGVDFRHGRLPIGPNPVSNSTVDVIPSPYYTQPGGFTVVGLDRQPFLREASSLMLYGGVLDIVDSTLPLPVIVSKTANGLGAILAIELGNPWPDPIDLSNYQVEVTDGTDSITLDLAGTLNPGDVAIVYHRELRSGDFTQIWQECYDLWRALVESRYAGVQLIDATSTDSVFDLSPTETPSVLLKRRIPGGVSAVTVLLDRMSPPANGEPFPYGGADNDQTIDVTDTQTFIEVDPASITDGSSVGKSILVGFVDGASFARPSENPAISGFPAYVVERAAENTIIEMSGADQTEFAMLDDDVVGNIDDLVVFDGDHNRLANAKPTFSSGMGSFQMFVPDGPLLSPAELLRLSIYAHIFVPTGLVPLDVTGADRDAASSPWTTVSEQLGTDAALAYNDVSPPATGNEDPFFGTLDFSRGIPGAPAADGGLVGVPSSVPHELRVPLAVRVVDAFETLGSLGTVAQGRININTAPDRVLRLLPLMDPRDESSGYNNGATIAGYTFQPSRSETRIEMLADYRSMAPLRLESTVSPGSVSTLNQRPDVITDLDGLRTPDSVTNSTAVGVTSLGELALMHEWAPNGGKPSANAARSGFAELAADLARQPAPTIGGAGAEAALDPRVSVIDAVSSAEYDGQDDLEERLAIFRAVSQVASNRSDVYIAWFIIRGYEPATIESIEIPGADIGSDDLRAQLLNQLQPAHESRWLAVLDRSKVRQPTDRPEIVLLVELPSTSP